MELLQHASGRTRPRRFPIIVGALLVEVVLALRKRWRDMLLVVIGLALELATFLIVNEVVRRERPSVDKLGIVPTTFSFPSGHTAATIVLYGSIVLLVTLHMRSRLAKVLLWILVLLLTVAVGYARVYRGMHHVSDVVTGAIMGIGALLVAVTATRASLDCRAAGGRAPGPGRRRRSRRHPRPARRQEVPA